MAIPTDQHDTTVVSTLTGQRGKFSVHEHAHEKIMGVLTNLYEDPEAAVIREYSTNALDSQIEAQANDPSYVWRPIEVTTPSHFSKVFKIRDFGVGMTVEDIEKVYSQYGYSTKEHTNDQTGMLGLGSKCGLTYTGQFTIIGYKNGLRTTALITLNEDEVPEYVIMDTSATTEPNGVEIQIPVKTRESFADKCASFFRWWKDGQVLVNGSEPAKHNYKEVKPGVFLIEKNGYSYGAPQSYVIMGNVPYAIDAEYVDAGLRDAGMGFAAYVPMGTVNFPPSRERLRYNQRTKDAVIKISDGLFAAIVAEKVKEITSAKTFREAWIARNGLAYHFQNHRDIKTLKFKGHDFAERVQHQHMDLDWDWQGHGQIAERQYITLSGLMHNGGLIVTGVPQGTKPTSYFKKKVKFYMEQNNIDGADALLVNDDVDSVWLDWLPRIDADTIKALKLPKNPGQAGPRVEAPYEFYYIDSNDKVVFDSQTTVTPAAGTTLVYISPQDMKETYRKSGCTPQDFLRQMGKDYTLVVLGKNRFEKFLRTHTAIKASKAVQDRIDTLVKNATDAEYQVGKLSYGEQEFMKSVDVSQIDDPDLAALAKVVQDKNFTANYAKAENLATFARRASIFPTLPEKKNVKGNPAKRYPLLDRVGGRSMKHLVIYINAVYEAEVKPQQP
jgi:hypothetical protein